MARNAIDKLLIAKGSYAPGATAVVLFLLLCLDSGGFFARGACAIGGAAALATLAISLIGIRGHKSSRLRSGNMAPCLLVCAVGTLLLISSLHTELHSQGCRRLFDGSPSPPSCCLR